eukprot:6209027-Pleurochrysis_carterae.AAC.3
MACSQFCVHIRATTHTRAPSALARTCAFARAHVHERTRATTHVHTASKVITRIYAHVQQHAHVCIGTLPSLKPRVLSSLRTSSCAATRPPFMESRLLGRCNPPHARTQPSAHTHTHALPFFSSQDWLESAASGEEADLEAENGSQNDETPLSVSSSTPS